MQIFFKSRESARSVKSGKMSDNWQGLPEHLKGVINGKASPKMMAIRDSVKEYLSSVGNNKFTTIDITKIVGCSVAEANNALTFYKNKFNISVVGKQEKEGKGKKPNLYQVCN